MQPRSLLQTLALQAMFSLLLVTDIRGNNITILNDTVIVSAYQAGNPGFRNLTFTVRWENSWNRLKAPGNIPNRDAAWIFVKYRKFGTATWHHAYLDQSGHSSGCGNNCNIETALRSTGSYNHQTNPVLGVFFYRNRNSPQESQYTFQENLTLRWNCESNTDRTIGPNDQVEVRVYAVEMAFVQEGSFTAGRTGASNGFRMSQGGDPYTITNAFSGSTMRHAAVVRDTATISLTGWRRGNSNDGDVTISNINVPAGQDQVLLVGVAFRENADPNYVNSVTFGGVALDSVVRVEDANKQGAYIYRLFNPSGTNQTLVVDIGNAPKGDSPKGVGVVAAFFSGVGSLGADNARYGDKAFSHSLPVSPTANKDAIFDIISAEFAISMSPHAGQDSITTGTRPDPKDFFFGASWRRPTGASATMGWNLEDDKKAGQAAVVMHPRVTFNNDGIWVDGDDGIRMVQNGVESEQNASFPTGFKAFYCMKYEITQGQYAAFLNTLTLAQQQARVHCDVSSDPPNSTFALDAGADSRRNFIRLRQQGGAFPARFGCDRDGDGWYNEADDGQYIACNFLLWSDVEAWLDWAGLRPMTELEYEKACRGVFNNQGDATPAYPWGSAGGNRISGTVGSWSSLGTASEVPANGENMAVHFNQSGSSPRINGPFRVGGYARPSSHGTKNREIAGASLTGVLELAGNLWEGAVSLSEVQGRSFTATHGDGDPATLPAWPGSLAQQNQFFGIIRRGGAWSSSATAELEVSHRPASPLFPTTRAASEAYGGRGVRSVN